MPEHIAFEKAFLELILDKIKEKEFSHSDFARTIFPGRPTGSAERTWRNLRSSQNDPRPREITLSEMLRMADKLETDLPTLMFQADQILKMKK
ncbi:hypothetical protein [Maridesulfovibrio sp.]|uniref:hypothetical protein n=1 Tax=Maridesulfovibrio sp. TaxID=2795000 RepID=UPI0029C9CD1B|nr:hypothetical protein [Maridesulfovibrio sp.]